MRGNDKTSSRHHAGSGRSIRALIAGAALLAGAVTATGAARAQTPTNVTNDDTAMAVPRIGPTTGGGIPLPQPLAPEEAARIRRIFALQDKGQFGDAARETTALGSDSNLLGHLLADRYLAARYRTTPDELKAWLARFADQPDAPALHALLLRRLPRGAPAPAAPPSDDAPIAERGGQTLPEDVDVPDPSVLRAPAHRQAQAAQMAFAHNRDEAALQMASGAFRQGAGSDRQVGLAGFVAGLAAWRLGHIEQAHGYFAAAARAPVTASSVRAGASYWAARAALRLGNSDEWRAWLRRAAAERRTFYGLLAEHAIGLGPGLSLDRETLGPADIEAIGALPGGTRAYALLQVGETARAEAEFRRLWPLVRDDPGLRRALMLITAHAGLIDLSADIATRVQGADGRPRDNARFPIPRLVPRGGFRVDPALVYALARLESNFDPSVVSPAGARGLMQLMPVTAGYIGNDPSLAGAGRMRLHDPALNLDIGQRYLMFLTRQDGIDGDLIRLLASYNSGTGSFARWNAEMRDGGDPLLYIESIPNNETRAFVQHVLAYSWIYAARLRLPAPSLDVLAAGDFPRFDPDASAARQASLRLH
jgi:hypothetical protein